MGLLRAAPFDAIEARLESLPVNWLSDVREKEAVKLENMLNVRDLGKPGRDFAFLGDGGFEISLGVGHADLVCLFMVMFPIEMLGGIFSALRLGTALEAA